MRNEQSRFAGSTDRPWSSGCANNWTLHGQTPVKCYNRELRDLIIAVRARPSRIVSHELPSTRHRRHTIITTIIVTTDGPRPFTPSCLTPNTAWVQVGAGPLVVVTASYECGGVHADGHRVHLGCPCREVRSAPFCGPNQLLCTASRARSKMAATGPSSLFPGGVSGACGWGCVGARSFAFWYRAPSSWRSSAVVILSNRGKAVDSSASA